MVNLVHIFSVVRINTSMCTFNNKLYGILISSNKVFIDDVHSPLKLFYLVWSVYAHYLELLKTPVVWSELLYA